MRNYLPQLREKLYRINTNQVVFCYTGLTLLCLTFAKQKKYYAFKRYSIVR